MPVRVLDSTRLRARRAHDAAVRFYYLIFTALGLWAFVLLAYRARDKPFWHDEIYTILTTELTPLADWRGRLDGLDLSPPLHAWLTHLVHASAGSGLLMTRLPSVVSLLVAMLCVALLVQRRTNILVGLCAGVLLCFTPAWNAAYEARGYAMTCACFSVALLAWAEGASARHRPWHWPAMALALAAGVWTHQFFVLAWLPITIGEGVRQLRRGRVEWSPWVALGAAGIACAPLVALVRANGAQRVAFWARSTEVDWWGLYEWVIGQLRLYNLRVAAGLIAALTAFEILRRWRQRRWPRGPAVHEVVAGLTCLALPAAGAALGLVLGIFTERYVTFTTVGLVIVFCIAAWTLAPRNGVATALMALTVLYSMVQLTRHTFLDPPGWRDPFTRHPLLVRALDERTPLFVTGGIEYLQWWYYASPESQPRLRYLADVPGELRATGIDTIDRGYLALGRWTRVPVIDVSTMSAGTTFRLYDAGANWVVATLRARGAVLAPIAAEPGEVLYEVRMPQ